MKRILCLILILSEFAAISATLKVPTRDFTSEPTIRRRTTLTLSEEGPVTAPPWLIAGDSVAAFTDTNGVAWYSNVLAAKYNLNISGSPGRSFPISVFDTNGILDAAVLVNSTNYNAAYYTAAQVDALIADIEGGGGSGTSGALTNNDTRNVSLTKTLTLGSAATDGSITLTDGDTKSFSATISADGWIFAQPVEATGFIGDGLNLTDLNASEITSGTLPVARIANGSLTTNKVDATFHALLGGSSSTSKFADYANAIQANTRSAWVNPNKLFQADLWNFIHVRYPSATRLNGNLFVYFASADTNDYTRGNVFSAVGTDWNNLQLVGVALTNTGGAQWDGGNVNCANVFQYGGTNWLFYFGGSSDDYGAATDWQIGVAYSSDGTNFTKYSGNPLLSKGSSGQWDDYSLISVHVIQDNNGKFFMFYGGSSDAQHTRIGFATSDSLTGPWVKNAANPVVAYHSAEATGISEFPTIIQDRHGWNMFFQSFSSIEPRAMKETLTYAFSKDLTNWVVNEASRPTVASPNYPNDWIFSPFVIDDGGLKLLWEDNSSAYLSESFTYNYASLTRQDFVGAQFYTNTSGQNITVQSDIWLTPASVAGKAGVDIRVGNGATMRRASGSSIQTIVGTLVASQTNAISTVVTNGEVYCFTNISTGSGNAAGLVGSTGFIKTEK